MAAHEETCQEFIPTTFSVTEYIEEVRAEGYANSRLDFDLDRLIADLPRALKSFTNDCVAKAMLSHCYGEGLSKHFRAWCRERMDESIQLPCAGASIGIDEEGLPEGM